MTTVTDPESLAGAADLTQRDGDHVKKLIPTLRLAMKRYFRSEVNGMEHVPEGGALLVSNHSGGLLAMDVPILAVAFTEHFGYDRPFYILAHDLLFTAAGGPFFRKAGFLPATRANAEAALRSGGVTFVFPGGDYDTFRPFTKANVIDFNGRTGYVRTALACDVPIVPAVSVGGQETQIFLSRGEGLAKLLRLDKLIRTKYMPVGIGFPFGLTPAFVPNLPLPTKIRTEVLAPIDVRAEFGDDPDIDEVDREVRARMQVAVDDLARQRRFPVLG